MSAERRYTPAEVAALLDAMSAGSAEWEALERVYPMEVAAAQWEQVRQKAAALRASQEQEPLPAIRITHYATATALEALGALEALEKEREAQWAAVEQSIQEQAEAAYEEHVELCENCAAELDSGSECIDGTWLCVNCWPAAAEEAADAVAIEAYEASVQHRLSDLANEGTWWAYGHVDPLHADDERQGYGVWLECTVGRESDTGVWLSEPEWGSWEGAADEAAARTEATRRNWGEG